MWPQHDPSEKAGDPARQPIGGSDSGGGGGGGDGGGGGGGGSSSSSGSGGGGSIDRGDSRGGRATSTAQ